MLHASAGGAQPFAQTASVQWPASALGSAAVCSAPKASMSDTSKNPAETVLGSMRSARYSPRARLDEAQRPDHETETPAHCIAARKNSSGCLPGLDGHTYFRKSFASALLCSGLAWRSSGDLF